MRGRMGNEVGSAGVGQTGGGCEWQAKECFYSGDQIQGDINKNREAKRQSRHIMEEKTKSDEEQVDLK